MGCCNSASAAAGSGVTDPSLHVNYVRGMVLGVDDYVQEFAYLSNRDQWAVRDLIGYGTASGLAVTVDADGESGPRIKVTAGSAAAPSGKLICVGRDQCAHLNAWLARPENARAVAAKLASASPPDSGAVRLYLTLCYRDCAVAPVPVPGEPCRSDEELMQPSRIADDYTLSLALDPPAQAEWDAIRAFAAWLDAIEEVADEPSPPLASPPAESPPSSPPSSRVISTFRSPAMRASSRRRALLRASPPSPDTAADWQAAIRAALAAIVAGEEPGSGWPPLTLDGDDIDAFTALALRLWITEYRPQVMAQRCGEAADAADDCVLLAAIDADVVHASDNPDTGWQASAATVDDSDRPILASLQWLESLGSADGVPGPQGPKGDPGRDGADGRDGRDGLDGANGRDGENGRDGRDGVDGRDASDLPFRLRTRIGRGAITLDDKVDCLILDGPAQVTLPPIKPDELSRSFWIKATEGQVVVSADPASPPRDSLEGLVGQQGRLVLSPPQAVQLVAAGKARRWHIIGAYAEAAAPKIREPQ